MNWWKNRFSQFRVLWPHFLRWTWWPIFTPLECNSCILVKNLVAWPRWNGNWTPFQLRMKKNDSFSQSIFSDGNKKTNHDLPLFEKRIFKKEIFVSVSFKIEEQMKRFSECRSQLPKKKEKKKKILITSYFRTLYMQWDTCNTQKQICFGEVQNRNIHLNKHKIWSILFTGSIQKESGRKRNSIQFDISICTLNIFSRWAIQIFWCA